MITEYTIVIGDFDKSLTTKVNELIKQGWQPYGNPYFGQCCSHQAMVKTDDHVGKEVSYDKA